MIFTKVYLFSVLIALLILLFGCNSILSAQQDSTASDLSLQELKQVAGLLTELKYRREETKVLMDKELVYKRMIQDFQNNEKNYEALMDNLKLNIEAVKPSWYDHFWIGSVVTGLIVTSIYLLAK